VAAKKHWRAVRSTLVFWGRSHVSSTGCTATWFSWMEWARRRFPGCPLRTPYASLALSGATHASSLYCTTVLTPITYPLAAADRARIVAVLLRKAYSPAALGRSPHVRAASYIYVCYSSRCMGYMLIRLEEDKVEGTSASVESGKHNITV